MVSRRPAEWIQRYAGCVCLCVCVRKRERGRQHFLALGHNDLASSVLYEASSNPDCIFNADLLCFPGKRSPVMGPKGLRKKLEAGSETSPGGSGGMLCVLVVPPGNITPQWLAWLSPLLAAP